MPLKCTACALAFAEGEDHREHYRSEWHKYNLKRKTASLGPVPKAAFDRKRAEFLRRAGQTHAANVPTSKKRKAQIKAKRAAARGAGSAASAASAGGSALTLGGSDYDIERVDIVNRLPNNVRLLGKGTEVVGRTEEEEAALYDDLEEPEEEVAPEPAPRPSRAWEPRRAGEGIAVAEDGDGSEDGAAAVDDAEHDDVEGEGEENTGEAEAAAVVLDAEVCMFCDARHDDAEACLEHMRVAHGFFVPEPAYCVDRDGLLRYLHEKVKLGHMCLNCNGYGRRERGANGEARVFPTARAAQAHMRDKGHCMLAYEEGVDMHEYEPYYDFTKSYVTAPAAIYANALEGGGDADGEEELDLRQFQLYENEYGELVLPSGRTVGHRDFKRYYDQRGRADREAAKGEAVLAVERDREEAVGMQLAAMGHSAGAIQRGGLQPWQMRTASGYGSGGNARLGGALAVRAANDAAREIRWQKRWANRQQLLQGIKNNQTSRMHLRMFTTVRSFST